jgi:hypothetical protein
MLSIITVFFERASTIFVTLTKKILLHKPRKGMIMAREQDLTAQMTRTQEPRVATIGVRRAQ